MPRGAETPSLREEMSLPKVTRFPKGGGQKGHSPPILPHPTGSVPTDPTRCCAELCATSPMSPSAPYHHLQERGKNGTRQVPATTITTRSLCFTL